MPSGSDGIVVDVRVFNRHGIEKDERSITIERAEIDLVQQDKLVEEEILERSINKEQLKFYQEQVSKKIKNLNQGDTLDQSNINEIQYLKFLK